MADDNLPPPTPQNDPAQGNSQEARSSTGELKDQNPSIPPSGTESKTSSEGSSDRSFLNRKPEAAPIEASIEDKPKEGEGEKKPETPQGAPDKYADFKLPDGYAFDPEALTKVSALFKDSNLSQDQAQKLVDYYAENSLQSAKAPYDMWAKLQSDWVGEIDNRFGSKADGMRNDINQAIDSAISSPKLRTAFREALDFTGAGSNPDFFEALSIFAKPFLEGTSVSQGRPAPVSAPKSDNRPSLAEALYPHLVQNRGQQ